MSLTKNKLIQILSSLKDLPGDAPIYIEADHSQNPEKAENVTLGYCSNNKFPYYGEDILWDGQQEKNEKIQWNCLVISY